MLNLRGRHREGSGESSTAGSDCSAADFALLPQRSSLDVKVPLIEVGRLPPLKNQRKKRARRLLKGLGAMASLGGWLRHALIREPVVVWSCGISLVGLALPLVVPPIRNALGAEKVTPPRPAQVANAMTGKG
ncbi:hypothetical protein KFL_001520170 [Klebsormidium nitens]|uniref:Uncharacterized protein n=1 Tax=Klebsormidium nitens TaxID=105231 RepID=A0A1Y1I470_KLENI|nr:hypothetical protein KFL_001520170 [Klebsormidium nitens]|eukprot:GAQ83547.1 hypothetical protein KFL_001520170 [Klebsormidium nitens]